MFFSKSIFPLTCVDDEIHFLTSFSLVQANSVGVDGSWVRIVFAHLDAERRSGDMNAVKLRVDGVDSVFSGIESNRLRAVESFNKEICKMLA